MVNILEWCISIAANAILQSAQVAQRDKYVWLMVVLHMKDVLKCAMIECGWLFMTVGGATIMPWWCADNLDIHINVSTSAI